MDWISPSVLRHKRIDPDYYAQEHLDTEAIVKEASARISFEPLGSFCRLWSGPFGSKLPSSLYRESGPYPLFRSQNVKAFWVQREGLVYLETAAFNDLHSCSVEVGDILVSKAGFVGTACIVGDNEGPAIITEHVLGVRPDDETDCYYLLACLNSSICRRQLNREGLGTILNYLGVEVSRELLVPRPIKRIQIAIGNKARAAQQLRVIAEALSLRIESLFPESVIGSTESTSQWLTEEIVESERLEAQYYQPHFLELMRILDNLSCKVVPLQVLIASTRHGASVTGTGTEGGHVRFIRGNEIMANRISSKNAVYLDDATTQSLAASHYVKTGDLLVTRSGTVGTCAVATTREVGAAFGSFVIAVQVNGGEHNVSPEYIATFLNSPLGQAQFRREENGAVQMNINNAELGRIRIPLFTEAVRSELDGSVQRLNESLDRAEELVGSAIADMDNLIQGTFDEAECIGQGRQLAEEFGLEVPQ